MFCFMDEKVVFPNSFLSDVLSRSPKIEMEDGWSCLYPSNSNWISTDDLHQEYVKVEFTAPTPLSIPEVESYTSNESSLSDYYRFTQVVLSLPPMEEVDLDVDLGIEHDDSSPFDGLQFCGS